MPLCHYLNVVAPRGLVNLEELPTGVGLLEPAGTGDGQRLITKRKAIWRDIALPVDLLVYVLMCRVKIVLDQEVYGKQGRVEQLRAWTEQTSYRQELSYAVHAKIRKMFDEQEARLREMTLKTAQLEQVKKRMVELGFDPEKSIDTWQMADRLKRLSGAVDAQTLQLLERAEASLRTARETLAALQQAR